MKNKLLYASILLGFLGFVLYFVVGEYILKDSRLGFIGFFIEVVAALAAFVYLIRISKQRDKSSDVNGKVSFLIDTFQ